MKNKQNCCNKNNNKSVFIFFLLFVSILIGNSLYAESILKSDSNLEEIDFYPKEFENNEFINFPKCKVYKLSKEFIDFANDNKSKIEREIGNIYNMCRQTYYVNKDCPEFSDRVKQLNERINEIYGPAVIQYLSMVKGTEEYDNLMPDKVFEKRDADVKNLAERKDSFKQIAPYLFGMTFNSEQADQLLTSFLMSTNMGGAEPSPEIVLNFHPYVLARDVDYIVVKFFQGRPFKLSFEKLNINWDFQMPKNFKLKSSEVHSDEIFISFETKIDGISGSYQVAPNYGDTKNHTPKTYLEKLSKDDDYLNMLVGNAKLVVSSTVSEFGKRPVLTVQYKKDQSSTASSSVAYVFLAGKFIFEFKFQVNIDNDSEAEQVLKANMPLFEIFVKANRVERLNK